MKIQKLVIDKSIFTKLILVFIVLLGLFFRTYKLENYYVFEHDQDLYSWIVKDILVDHHFRLIGQLTSVDGVFIGPFFYYLLVPFFAIMNLDPIAATISSTILGLLTVISVYFIFSNMFTKTTGIVGATLYAVTISTVFWDRWVVPTQPTLLWSFWYLYALFSLLRGNQRAFPLLGLLFGLIWHVHIALLPLVPLSLIAFLFSKKQLRIKSVLLLVAFFMVLTAPFWIFEFRHNFQQINGFVSSLTIYREEPEGYTRLTKIFDAASGAFAQSLLWGVKIPVFFSYLLFLLTLTFLKIKKSITSPQLLIIILWIVLLVVSQLLSKRGVSEYYFANFIALNLLVFSLLISILDFVRRWLVAVILVGIVLTNTFWLFQVQEFKNSYLYKKQAVDFIKKDADSKDFFCISINYITNPGAAVGFRYLFWWKDANIIRPGSNAPIYNIVIPWQVSANEVDAYFGSVGVILPETGNFKDEKVCDDSNNYLDPLLGFTK
ncbi:hypothetical protein C4577_00915 [Candidatus Parcubacteria bacterium]|nr:MAG: hypothetical protein C4577_00915 [Candidatus Parcubacteria bacterium]